MNAEKIQSGTMYGLYIPERLVASDASALEDILDQIPEPVYPKLVKYTTSQQEIETLFNWNPDLQQWEWVSPDVNVKRYEKLFEGTSA